MGTDVGCRQSRRASREGWGPFPAPGPHHPVVHAASLDPSISSHPLASQGMLGPFRPLGLSIHWLALYPSLSNALPIGLSIELLVCLSACLCISLTLHPSSPCEISGWSDVFWHLIGQREAWAGGCWEIEYLKPWFLPWGLTAFLHWRWSCFFLSGSPLHNSFS